jgi:hypothetical protein
MRPWNETTMAINVSSNFLKRAINQESNPT